MATQKSVEALQKTRDALKQIQKQLLPFLRELSENGPEREISVASKESSVKDPDVMRRGKIAMASMAVALAMGTLRYMGARLRGLDQGRKSDDLLRKELNDMRKLMVTLQKKIDESKKQDNNSSKRRSNKKEMSSPSPAKRRRK